MFIINPLSGQGMDNLFATHPSTENRIAALQPLAAEMGAQATPSVGANENYPPQGRWASVRRAVLTPPGAWGLSEAGGISPGFVTWRTQGWPARC